MVIKAIEELIYFKNEKYTLNKTKIISPLIPKKNLNENALSYS